MLPDHEIILHRFAEGTFSKEPNSYFSDLSVNSALLLSLLQLGINIIQN